MQIRSSLEINQSNVASNRSFTRATFKSFVPLFCGVCVRCVLMLKNLLIVYFNTTLICNCFCNVASLYFCSCVSAVVLVRTFLYMFSL